MIGGHSVGSSVVTRHSDYRQAVARKILVPFRQRWKRVEARSAPSRPEIEKHHLAPQRSEGLRRTRKPLIYADDLRGRFIQELVLFLPLLEPLQCFVLFSLRFKILSGTDKGGEISFHPESLAAAFDLVGDELVGGVVKECRRIDRGRGTAHVVERGIGFFYFS